MRDIAIYSVVGYNVLDHNLKYNLSAVDWPDALFVCCLKLGYIR